MVHYRQSADDQGQPVVMMCFSVVYFPSRPNEPGHLRSAIDDEPRVDGNAMTAHAGAGPENVDPRMPVCHLDNMPDIKSKSVADDRQLVREGDIDVTEGILCQLDKSRAVGISQKALAPDEELIEFMLR